METRVCDGWPPNLRTSTKLAGPWSGSSKKEPVPVRSCAGFGHSQQKTSTQRAPVNLNDLAIEVVSLLERELVRHQVVLRTELAERLPSVKGDRVQLQQVIFNLAVNAI